MSPMQLLKPAAVAMLAMALASPVSAQFPGGRGGGGGEDVVGQPDFKNTNLLPNPYRTIENWAQLPEGRTWGSTSSVAIDPDGLTVWVADRCEMNARGCAINSDMDPIFHFDADGTLLTSFGAGLTAWPHGIDVDQDGNVWIADGNQSAAPAGRGGGPPPNPDEVYGMQVLKFSPEGELLMSLGAKGGVPMDQRDGAEIDYFWQPNDVLVAPNGDIFVAEGHGNNPETSPARILKFNSEGELLMTWGEMGNGPGQFMQPHALAMDSRGNLFVGDRANNRVQIFDQDGNFIDMWYQFSRPSGLWIDKNDWLYSADSESLGVSGPSHADWKRGIRVGSAVTGEVYYLIPDPCPTCGGTSAAEGVAVDQRGVIYGAEVGPQRLQKYVWREVW